MKKNILKIVFITVSALISGKSIGIIQNITSFSTLVLDNVEALAGGETETCPKGCVSGRNGCYCNGGWYSYCTEVNWD